MRILFTKPILFLASKVELFLSNEDTNTVEDAEKINWEYLGYITLSTNETTEFKSRELKSANVPKNEVTFVKINLHRNHVNHLNVHNQVNCQVFIMITKIIYCVQYQLYFFS